MPRHTSGAAEGLRIWTDILSLSRFWGTISIDFFNDPIQNKVLIYRHIAWLTALRYYLREDRVWESNEKSHSKEYQQFFHIPERMQSIESELKKFVSDHEQDLVIRSRNRTGKILAFQSKTIKSLNENGQVNVPQYAALQQMIKDFYNVQRQM